MLRLARGTLFSAPVGLILAGLGATLGAACGEDFVAAPDTSATGTGGNGGGAGTGTGTGTGSGSGTGTGGGTAECGNGTQEAGEECDDGNLDGGDGCQPTCLAPTCGDNYKDTADGEECDDGNAESGDGCQPTCLEPACGDGYEDTADGEECDDGNAMNGDGCSDQCKLPECFDGIHDPGELCFALGVSVTPTVTPTADFAVFDCNGDNALDIVAISGTDSSDTSKTLSTFVGMNNGKFGAATALSGITTKATSLVVAELDGNSTYRDLAIAHYGKFNVLSGAAGCSFGLFGGGPLKVDGRDIAALNADKTGKTDLVTVSVDSATPTTGNLSLKRGDVTQSVHHGLFGNPTAVAAGDFDADGDDDVAYLSVSSSMPKLIVLTTGMAADVTFTPFTQLSLAADGYDVQFADMDGDGDLDLVAGVGDVVRVYRNDGNGFADVGGSKAEGTVKGLVAADLDGDGDKDVATADGAGKVVIHVNDGLGVLKPAAMVPVAAALDRIAAADVDGDGNLDLLVEQDKIYVLAFSP